MSKRLHVELLSEFQKHLQNKMRSSVRLYQVQTREQHN